MRYDFDVHEVDESQALEMVRKYHYSDTLPKINRHFVGCFLGGGAARRISDPWLRHEA